MPHAFVNFSVDIIIPVFSVQNGKILVIIHPSSSFQHVMNIFVGSIGIIFDPRQTASKNSATLIEYKSFEIKCQKKF